MLLSYVTAKKRPLVVTYFFRLYYPFNIGTSWNLMIFLLRNKVLEKVLNINIREIKTEDYNDVYLLDHPW